jgi:RNA polymerase sigma-70 factor (ECF subfamily)
MASTRQTELREWAGVSDEELFIRAQVEPDVFSVLFERYSEGFLRKATYILGNVDEAQDAVQETFVKLYSKARSYEVQIGVPWKSWAYRVLVNHCLSMIRSRVSRQRIGALLSDDVAESVADLGVERSFSEYLDRDYLVSLVVRLPDVLARTVRSAIFEDRPESEIAEEEGVSETAIRVRLTRARKELRKLAESVT